MLRTAGIGVLSLYIGSELSLSMVSQSIIGWWLGDAVGILVFTPLLLFFVTHRGEPNYSFLPIQTEFITAFGCCVVLAWIVFGDFPLVDQYHLPLAFLVIPPLIWIGLRFNGLKTFIAVLAIAMIALIGATKGLGPFISNNPSQDQLILCIFIATITLTSLMMIGIQANQRRTEEKLKVSLRHQQKLRLIAEQEQSRLSALLSAMSLGILFEDKEQRVEYVNPAFLRLWGITDHARLLNKPTPTVLLSANESLSQPSDVARRILQVSDTQEVSDRLEFELSSGKTLTQLSYPVNDADGGIMGRLWMYEDITQARQTAQQLLYLAERDPLTGLFNRHRFQEQLNLLITASLRSQQKFALLYFDLDDFKYINDTFGHRAGDTVLVRAAGEISSVVRHIEVFARLGGDEFAILSHIWSEHDLSTLPSRIVTTIASIPVHFHETNIRLTTSVGVAIFPEHGESAEDLIAHADTAMYQAKKQGKNTWSIYDPNRDSSKAMIHRMSWYNRILQALEQDLLELHFQGVYTADHSMLVHVEALVRMQDIDKPGQLFMPGQFIPIAEKNGQIVNIDRWVINRSIALLQQYPEMPPIAINISGRTFDDPAIPYYIRNLLSEYQVSPQRLIVELTETAAVSDIQDAQRFIEAIHQAGCRVCLDDFGSGFSTFSYLKYLGVEILKIDGLFIRDLPNNPDNQIFVKAMVDVARGLGKLTVAEFVEDAATQAMVQQLGIDLVQGYYLGRPDKIIPSKSQFAASVDPYTKPND